MQQYKQADRDRAAEVDLLTFLQYHRPDDLKRAGRGHRSKTYSSLWINNGVWTYYASHNPKDPEKHLSGRSALDFLIKVEHMPITDAINLINGNASYSPTPASKKPHPKPFALPPADKDNDRVIEYLTGRGISREVIDFCIGEGILYQTTETAVTSWGPREFKNCVFVGRDAQGIPRSACLRGTGKKPYRREVEGSDKRYSFFIPADPELVTSQEMVTVYESPIEAMSFATMKIDPALDGIPEDWREYHYLSLNGRSLVALVQFMKDHDITCASVRLNNDQPGRSATKTIINMLHSANIAAFDCPPPKGNDYNQYLQHCRQLNGLPVTSPSTGQTKRKTTICHDERSM